MLHGSLLITCSIYLHGPSMMMVRMRAILVAARENMLVGVGLRPEYSQDSFKVLGVEDGQFSKVAFSYPPAF